MPAVLWPSYLRPSRVELSLVQAGASAVSQYNGALDTITYIAERWRIGITLPPVPEDDGYRVQAFLRRLALGKRLVQLGPHLRCQYVPQGTMRGSPVLASTASRGDGSLSITTTAGATLLAGDFIGCSGQLFEISDDCVASSGGLLTAPLSNRVRATISSGTAVVWNQPTAGFALPAASVPFVSSPAILEPVTLDFIESWGVNAI